MCFQIHLLNRAAQAHSVRRAKQDLGQKDMDQALLRMTQAHKVLSIELKIFRV